MGKKDLLKRAFWATGITWARWRCLPRALSVFNFHRVGNREDCAYNQDLISCSAERLEELLILFKERFSIVTLAQLSHYGRRGYSGSRPLALITFDDGYIDNYSLSYPLLRKLEIPAVFFLPTDYIGTRRILWSDEIAWMLRHSRNATIRLPSIPKEFELSGENIDLTIREILRHVRRSPVPISEQIERIREACGGESPRSRGDRPAFVTWSHVREMCNGGMDIGSHTHTHPLLSRLSVGEQNEELTNSRAILEHELGSHVRALAYPVGAWCAYTPQTCSLARKAGYEFGFNFIGYPNPLPLRDWMNIGRFGVEAGMGAVDIKSITGFPRLFANWVKPKWSFRNMS